jgi:hypothetical protein
MTANNSAVEPSLLMTLRSACGAINTRTALMYAAKKGRLMTVTPSYFYETTTRQ